MIHDCVRYFIPILDDIYAIHLYLKLPAMTGKLCYFEKDRDINLYVFDIGNNELEVLHRMSFKKPLREPKIEFIEDISIDRHGTIRLDVFMKSGEHPFDYWTSIIMLEKLFPAKPSKYARKPKRESKILLNFHKTLIEVL